MIDYLDKNMCKFIKRLFMKLSGTKTITEEISVDASNLQNQLQLQISDISEQITKLENKKPDLNTDLWHTVEQISVIQGEKHGLRSTIGLDFEIIETNV